MLCQSRLKKLVACTGSIFAVLLLWMSANPAQADVASSALVAPTVTINQASVQPDPTNTSPIQFTVVFSQSVTGFTSSDVSFAGSTIGGVLVASVSGGGAAYTVNITGMNGVGTVVASIPAGAAVNASAQGNIASTSVDNTVTFDNVRPTVTINQAAAQPDPDTSSPILFAVVFSEAVVGFTGSDISFAGSTVGGTLQAAGYGSGANYTVSVTGMGSNGIVTAGLNTSVVTDLAGNTNFASTSTDNTVTFIYIVPSLTPPAPGLNIISNGAFSAGLNDWAFSSTTQVISGGALQIAPVTPGGSFYQFVNFNSAGEIFEVNFRASNSSATVKTLNLIVRDSDWSPQYNCVFTLAAFAPFQNYRMRFDTSAGFIPMIFQGVLSGDASLGLLIDDITMVRKTSIVVPSTQCVVSPPANTNLISNGDFNLGTTNWAAFNAAMQVVNIGGANGNIMELARWNSTPNGGFYQFMPYSAPANGVFQFDFQMANQSNTSRVINMVVRDPAWLDVHSCFITLPPNTPLTNFQIVLKTTSAWTNIVLQGWIQVGNYTGTPPLPFRFDNLSIQYQPLSGFGGTTQCPGPLPVPQHPTTTPSPTMTPGLTTTYTATMTETASTTPAYTETPLPSATATASETPTATVELPTSTPSETATDAPTPEPPTPVPSDTPSPEPPTAEPPTSTPEPPEVTQNP